MNNWKKLENLLERCDVVLTDAKKSLFTTKNLEQDLSRLISENSTVRPGMHQQKQLRCAYILLLDLLESPYAMQALACVMAHLEVSTPPLFFSQLTLLFPPAAFGRA